MSRQSLVNRLEFEELCIVFDHLNRSVMAQSYLRFSSIVCFTCIVLFSGCVSLKQTNQTGIKKINELSAFNGIYQNTWKTRDSLNYASLWQQLNLSSGLDAPDFKTAKIELTAIGTDQLKAVWWQENTPKAELILKGKLKDNYFVSRSKRKVIPIPLIYGEFKNNQFQLSISENNNLILDRLENQWGWVFIFLASNDSTKSYEYQRDK